MDNKEWIYDYLIEMFESLSIEVTDNISDIISTYSKDISDGITEGYYCSSNYVADCNARESIKSNENREINELKNEIKLLEKFIQSKGYNFKIRNNSIYETGMEYIGGDLMASFEREIK